MQVVTGIISLPYYLPLPLFYALNYVIRCSVPPLCIVNGLLEVEQYVKPTFQLDKPEGPE